MKANLSTKYVSTWITFLKCIFINSCSARAIPMLLDKMEIKRT